MESGEEFAIHLEAAQLAALHGRPERGFSHRAVGKGDPSRGVQADRIMHTDSLALCGIQTAAVLINLIGDRLSVGFGPVARVHPAPLHLSS